MNETDHLPKKSKYSTEAEVKGVAFVLVDGCEKFTTRGQLFLMIAELGKCRLQVSQATANDFGVSRYYVGQ